MNLPNQMSEPPAAVETVCVTSDRGSLGQDANVAVVGVSRSGQAEAVRVYGIADLEPLSGVPRTTVHYYLRKGLLPPPHKTAASRSLYTEEHLRRLVEIRKLREAGRSLAEIKAEVETQPTPGNGATGARELTADLVAQEYRRVHNRILALAVREFAAKGYARTHVTSLLKQLGITATVFYTHFPSKRALLAECVSVLMRWSLAYADEKMAAADDPAERLLWEVFSHARVFELGATGAALLRVEGGVEGADLRRSLEESLAATAARIRRQLPFGGKSDPQRSVLEELLALSLLGAYEQTVFCVPPGREYRRYDLLRAHLWLYLAVQAALAGEIDIDSRVGRYEKLIEHLGTQLPPLPPELLEND